jgi:hypothetical protein
VCVLGATALRPASKQLYVELAFALLDVHRELILRRAREFDRLECPDQRHLG